MKIIKILIIILVILGFGCKFDEKTIESKNNNIKQDSIQIETIENSEITEQSNLTEIRKIEKPFFSDSGKTKQSTKIDTVKYTPSTNITHEQKESTIKDIKSKEFTRGLYLTAYKVASADFKNILAFVTSYSYGTISLLIRSENNGETGVTAIFP